MTIGSWKSAAGVSRNVSGDLSRLRAWLGRPLQQINATMKLHEAVESLRRIWNCKVLMDDRCWCSVHVEWLALHPMSMLRFQRVYYIGGQAPKAICTFLAS